MNLPEILQQMSLREAAQREAEGYFCKTCRETITDDIAWHREHDGGLEVSVDTQPDPLRESLQLPGWKRVAIKLGFRFDV